MSLTVGSGPFGRWPAGTFNFEPPPLERLLYFEQSPRRVRARLADETVADSRRMRLLRAWAHPEPPPEASFLRGHVSLAFGALDEWLEEDEPIDVHPKDPYSRIDVLRTSRRVRVSLDGRALAASERALVLFESALPPRWYLPREDVRMELLVPSDTRTMCPYKGEASYFSARLGGRVEEDLAWCYEEPRHDAVDVRGRLAFFDERVDLELDGERVERPRTQWSR